MKPILAVLVCLTLWPLAGAEAAPSGGGKVMRPGVVYDANRQNDRSFNEAILRGFQRFQSESGISFLTGAVPAGGSAEETLRQLAASGADPIIAAGFTKAGVVRKVAPDFPQTRFAVIDDQVDLPNVRSFRFTEHEGSFLAGVAAALTSKSGTIGFIGGMDSILIRRFECGYRQGALHARPAITVLHEMIGDTPAAFAAPERGRALAFSQMQRGADVLYTAAGGSSLGVLAAAAENGRLGIGVDSNQNHLHPGRVLTSMLKRVDIAAYLALRDAQQGNWQSGVTSLGLTEGAIDLAMDENNALLLSDRVLEAVDEAKTSIMLGRIKVHDYAPNAPCPLK